MKIKILTLLVVAMLVAGCGNKQVPRERVPEHVTTETDVTDGVRIPYEPNGSHEMVTVSFNGVPMNLLWDTGCATTLIPVTEFQRMIREGKISGYDYSDTKYAQIADGSIVENFEFNIRDVSFNTTNGRPYVLHDISVLVSPNPNSSSLLGKNVIDQLGQFYRDESESCFVLKQ